MINLRVKNLNGDTVLNTFPIDFVAPKEETEQKKKRRYLRKNTAFGVLEILVCGENRITSSNKVFKIFVSSLQEALEMFIEDTSSKAKKMTDDYLHNIIKIHGNQKSIIERCIDEAEGRYGYGDFVEAVKGNLQRNPDEFAEDICALSKEIRLIDYHIGGYNLLHDTNSRVSITNNHNLKKFLLGLSHLFFDEFKKNNIILSLHGIDEGLKCSFEYETFNIAMHSFLENIIKYSKPYTTVSVYAINELGKLIFEMESIRIDRSEIDNIFERGVHGKYVPDCLRGKGIGMYQLRMALDRSDITIDIRIDYSQDSELNGINYTKNTFTFVFSNYSI